METANTIRTDLDHLFNQSLAIERVNAFAKIHELIKTKRAETRQKVEELMQELGIITTASIIEIHQTMNREQKEIDNAFIKINGAQIKIIYLLQEITNQNQY